MSKLTVLTISEDLAFRAALAEGLRGAAVEFFSANPGREAVTFAEGVLPELVVVDDRLTAEDPLECCRLMRAILAAQHSLVMIVSPAAQRADGRAANEPRREGAPADQPFDQGSLVRSIVALAGAPDRASSHASAINAQGLEMDRRRMRATVDGRELRFTPTEFRIVWTLARKPGIVFSRQQLCDACRDSDAPVQARTIDVHVRTIRQKLGPRADLVETVRGVGYRFLDSTPLAVRIETTLTHAEQLLS